MCNLSVASKAFHSSVWRSIFFFRHNLGVLRVGKFEMAREGRNWIPTFSDVAVFVWKKKRDYILPVCSRPVSIVNGSTRDSSCLVYFSVFLLDVIDPRGSWFTVVSLSLFLFCFILLVVHALAAGIINSSGVEFVPTKVWPSSVALPLEAPLVEPSWYMARALNPAGQLNRNSRSDDLQVFVPKFPNWNSSSVCVCVCAGSQCCSAVGWWTVPR